MQSIIHPAYQSATFACSCGNSLTTRSTLNGRISVDVCSNCHPHYTGTGRVVDTFGRIERFFHRYGKK